MAAPKTKGPDLALVFGPAGAKAPKGGPMPMGEEEEGEGMEGEEAPTEGVSPAFRAVAEEYLDAVASGDRETAISTLKEAIVMCFEEHEKGAY